MGNFSYQTRMVQNQAPQSPVSPQKFFKALKGPNGQSWLLAIGSDDVLRLIHKTSASDIEWQETALSGDADQVTTFSVYQDYSTGQFTVVYSAENDGPQLYYCASCALADLESSSFQQVALPATIPSNASITDISTSAQNVLFATTVPGQQPEYYLMDQNQAVSTYQLPANGTEILSIALGQLESFAGVFVLYNTSEDQFLNFLSFPMAQYGGKEYKQRYDCNGKTMTSMVVLEPNSDSATSQVVVAGEEVLYFSTPYEQSIVYTPPSGVTATELEVSSSDASNLSLWINFQTTGQQNYLSLLIGSESNSTWTWNGPIVLQKDVASFSGLVTDGVIENQAFYISSANELYYLYQDGGSKIWQNSQIFLSSIGETRKFYSYNAVLSFDLSDLQNTSAPTVTLTSSYLANILINGNRYQIGPDTPIDITLTESNLYLSYEVDILMGLILYVQADFLEGQQVVDLAENFCSNVLGLNSPEALRTAPVIGEIIQANSKLTDTSLQNFINGVSEILDFRQGLLAASTGQSQVAELDIGGGPDDPPTSSDTIPVLESETGEELALITEEEFAVGLGPLGMLIAFGAAIASLILILENEGDKPPKPAYIQVTFKKISASEAELLVKIGDKIGLFKITEAAQVLPIIVMMFKGIGVSSSDLQQWDGFQFDDGTMATAITNIENLIDQGLEVVSQTNASAGVFQDLQQQLNAASPVLDFDGETLNEFLATYEGDATTEQDQSCCRNPLTSWLQLNVSSYVTSGFILPTPDSPTDTFDYGSAEAAAETLASQIPSLNDLTGVFGSTEPLSDLQGLLGSATNEAIISYFKTVQSLGDDAGLTGILNTWLDQALDDIPFVSALYDSLFPGKTLTVKGYLAMQYAYMAVPYCQSNGVENPLDLQDGLANDNAATAGQNAATTIIALTRIIRACPTFPKSRNLINRVKGDSSGPQDEVNQAANWFAGDCFVRLVGLLSAVTAANRQTPQSAKLVFLEASALLYTMVFTLSLCNLPLGGGSSRSSLEMQAKLNATLVFLAGLVNTTLYVGDPETRKPDAIPVTLFQLMAFQGSYLAQGSLSTLSIADVIPKRATCLFIAGLLGLGSLL